MRRFLCVLALLLLGAFAIVAADSTKAPTVKEVVKQSEQKIKTRYSISGDVVNQAQNAKGYHRVTGTATLANGVDTVVLNASVSNGRQDVSFLADSTYFGTAWPLSISHRSKRYSVLPLSGTRFVVVSSDSTDTATVRFQVEGE